LDPNLHPFEKAREYTRALNATKLERLFSKPFLGALTGHIDGVYSLAKHPTHLTSILSGSADGGKNTSTFLIFFFKKINYINLWIMNYEL